MAGGTYTLHGWIPGNRRTGAWSWAITYGGRQLGGDDALKTYLLYRHHQSHMISSLCIYIPTCIVHRQSHNRVVQEDISDAPCCQDGRILLTARSLDRGQHAARTERRGLAVTLRLTLMWHLSCATMLRHMGRFTSF